MDPLLIVMDMQERYTHLHRWDVIKHYASRSVDELSAAGASVLYVAYDEYAKGIIGEFQTVSRRLVGKAEYSIPVPSNAIMGLKNCYSVHDCSAIFGYVKSLNPSEIFLCGLSEYAGDGKWERNCLSVTAFSFAEKERVPTTIIAEATDLGWKDVEKRQKLHSAWGVRIEGLDSAVTRLRHQKVLAAGLGSQ